MKILIVGCGSIGRRHMENVSSCADEVAACDLNDDNLNKATQNKNVKGFKDLSEALAWGANAVVVATPHITHIDIACKAVLSGAHVMIEKPISHVLDGVQELLDLAKENGKVVYTVCNMRFHPAITAIREYLPQIGKVLYARAQYGNYLPNMRADADYKKLYCAHKDQGGGVIMDVIHEIDYLRWLFGDAESVKCDAATLSDLDIDVEDYAHINLRHKNNVRCEIHMDYLKPYKRRGCEVVGDKGMLLWNSEGKNPEHCTVKHYDVAQDEWKDIYASDNLDANAAYEALMKEFIDGISGQKISDIISSGHDGLEALKIALAAQKSATQKGQEILFDEVMNNHE